MANDENPGGKGGTRPGVASGIGRFVGSHPVWTVILLVLFLGEVGRFALQKEPANSRPDVSKSPSHTGQTTAGSQQKQGSAAPSSGNESGFSAQQRQNIAQILDKNFQDQDIEVSVFTGGGNEDEKLFLSSELLKDPNGRTTVLHLVRAHWQDLLCKAGFKTIVLSDTGVLSMPRDYPLRCPWTAGDRATLATSIRDDLLKGGMTGTVEASGRDKNCL